MCGGSRKSRWRVCGDFSIFSIKTAGEPGFDGEFLVVSNVDVITASGAVEFLIARAGALQRRLLVRLGTDNPDDFHRLGCEAFEKTAGAFLTAVDQVSLVLPMIERGVVRQGVAGIMVSGTVERISQLRWDMNRASSK